MSTPQEFPDQPRVPVMGAAPRFATLLLPLIISVLMSCVITGVATLKSAGLAPDFLARWMGAWGVSWLVAFPTLLVVLPLARHLVGRLVRAPAR